MSSSKKNSLYKDPEVRNKLDALEGPKGGQRTGQTVLSKGLRRGMERANR